MDNAALVKLIFGLQGTGFLALIGVYIWSFKLSQTTDAKISKIYDTLNSHIQKAEIHQDDSQFVRHEVFEMKHTQLTANIDELKSGVKDMAGDIREVLQKVG